MEHPLALRSVPSVLAPVLQAPGARWGAQIADDPAEGYTLLFSGSSGGKAQNSVVYGDTWTYRSGAWTDITPSTCTNATCPESRTYGGMAYYNQSTQQYVVLFGGQYSGTSGAYLSDTWIFNGSWHNVTPSPLVPYVNSPPGLHWTSMAWDPVDGYDLLYGGCTLSGCDLNSEISDQTWAFEGLVDGVAHWVNLTTSVHPPGLFSPGLAFDSTDGYLLLFGGVTVPTSKLVYEDQTWSYTAATGWVNRTASTESATNTPPTRVWTMMADYPTNHYVVLFAGQENGNKTNNPTLDDTWTYTKGTWTNITSSLTLSPHGRFGGAMALDESDNALVLFGGLSGTIVKSPVLNDTWWFSGTPGTWTNHSATQYATFTESGLPTGTTWWVNLTNGQSFDSSSRSCSFAESNGTYNYTVATGDKIYAPTVANGTFVIQGDSVSESVTFSLVTYAVTFTESGLPSGAEWWVNLTSGQNVSSTSTTVAFTEPNGTYDFSVATSDVGYAPESPTGSFRVNGGPIAESVDFESAYGVAFTESGLPAGSSWWLNLTNGQSFSSTTATLSFREPNGTFGYVATTANKRYASPGGNFTVNGSAVSVTVTYSLVTFGVIFTESGLPIGTSWFVNITGGLPYRSSGTTITFAEPNGTYSFTVATSNKSYMPKPTMGNFIISGAADSEGVAFVLTTYTCTFTESGLPAGTLWWVNLTEGATFNSTSNSLGFLEPNGTYDYSVTTVNKEYAPGSAAGSFTVMGSPVDESETFGPETYSIIFTESGLPNGANWSVSLIGSSSAIILVSSREGSSITVTHWSNGGSTVQFFASNGSYSYFASASGHFSDTGTLTVKGSNVAPVALSFRSTSSSPSTFPSTTDYEIIGAVLVVCVVAVVVLLSRRRSSASTDSMPPSSSPPKESSPPAPPP